MKEGNFVKTEPQLLQDKDQQNNVFSEQKKEERQDNTVFSLPFSTAVIKVKQPKLPLNIPNFYQPHKPRVVLSAPATVLHPTLAADLTSTYYPKLWHQPQLYF